MAGFTRGFRGRGQAARDTRLPPGQYDAGSTWPVLTAEPNPDLRAEDWTIAVGGGLSGLSGDLRGLRLRGLDVRGGVDELELSLPAPDGTRDAKASIRGRRWYERTHVA